MEFFLCFGTGYRHSSELTFICIHEASLGVSARSEVTDVVFDLP